MLLAVVIRDVVTLNESWSVNCDDDVPVLRLYCCECHRAVLLLSNCRRRWFFCCLCCQHFFCWVSVVESDRSVCQFRTFHRWTCSVFLSHEDRSRFSTRYYSAALYVGRALCISRACTITWGINSIPELFSDITFTYQTPRFYISDIHLSRFRHTEHS